jgi:hypothetical protein
MRKLAQPALLVALGMSVSFAALIPGNQADLLPLSDLPQVADSVKKDSLNYPKFKDLPLVPEREVKFTTQEGTWMSVDVSPDGKTIAFDLMGDIYTIPIEGGKAVPLTRELPMKHILGILPMEIKSYLLLTGPEMITFGISIW